MHDTSEQHDYPPVLSCRVDHTFGCLLGLGVAGAIGATVFRGMTRHGFAQGWAVIAAVGAAAIAYPLCGALLSLLVDYAEYRVRLMLFRRRRRRR